ncbi:unnamed protein product [Soboliphyme baturini]|uniref:Secreted protein n=1 Tax=Soboliphyme baturini TaxID=241478 RepID=A0A183J9R6_9BILA|nr:unnamed protein product [Soboliphyme baturini]
MRWWCRRAERTKTDETAQAAGCNKVYVLLSLEFIFLTVVVITASGDADSPQEAGRRRRRLVCSSSGWSQTMAVNEWLGRSGRPFKGPAFSCSVRNNHHIKV